MKKIALALLATLSCSAASAQYIATHEVGKANNWAGFTAAGYDKVADLRNGKITVYNQDFSVDRTFNIVGNESLVPTHFDGNIVTQRLFNDDDLYEVVMEDLGSNSLVVYNENGENLGQLPGSLTQRPTLMLLGELSYIYTYDGEASTYTFYAIGQGTGNRISLRKVRDMRLTPDNARNRAALRPETPATDAVPDGASELRKAESLESSASQK